MQHVRAVVADEFEAVNELIINRLESRVPLVENIGHYIVDSGGKRLRPLLTLLSAGCFGEITQQHVQLAAVIEFIHTATLLHDDVVDISTLRRGRPTANAEFGNAPSVLVGDFLYSRAFQMLVELENMEVMALLADTTNRIAEGEVLQLIRAGQPDTTEEQYFDVINSKTAILFAAATKGSAILSGCDSTEIDSVGRYGMHLGTAFQLIDDVLDYSGSADEMGKNVGDDLNEGKPTLPLITAMQRGSDSQRQLIRSAIENKDNSQLQQLIDIVTETEALEYTREQAEKHNLLACEALTNLPQSDYKRTLIQISEDSNSRLA